MDGSVELSSDREGGNGPNIGKQIVPRSMSATASRRSIGNRLRGLFRAVASGGKSAVCSLVTVATSPRTLSSAALLLASVAVFLGPIGWPGSAPTSLTGVSRIETQLAAANLAHTHAADSTALLVAVQFVTAAAERSAPFDTALAVAISMIGEHPKIGPLLDDLLAEAERGVPSLEELRTEFQAKLAEYGKNGLLADDGSGAGRSSFRLGRLLGWGLPETSPEVQATLLKLSTDVANRQIAPAVQLTAKLDGRLREALESWREKAERRVAVDAVLAELRRAAFTQLIGKAS
jgi:hypothetical protein